MKRIILILLAACICLQIANAQQAKFEMAKGIFKEGETSDGLFNFQDNTFWAFIGSPTKKQGMLQLYSYSLKQFNYQLEEINSRKLPEFLPKSYSVSSFRKYLIFNGANDESQMNSTRKENILVFSDREFNLVKEINRKVRNDNFRLTNNFKLVKSDDGTKLMVISYVNENAGKPGGQKLRAFIDVYDSNLEVVWEKNFYIEKYLGNDPDPVNFRMLRDSRIMITVADNDGSKSKLRICIFTDQESEPQVISRSFDYPTISISLYVKSPERIIIGGLASNADRAKELYYLEYNVDKNEFVVDNTTILDKKFTSAYPDISKALNLAFPKSSRYSTDYFMPWGDGTLVILDGSYYYDGMYNPRPITFLSLNSEGKVSWVKLIPRFLETTFEEFTSYLAFARDDKLQIFYGADPEMEGKPNIPFSAKNIVTGIGMYYSELDLNGNLTPGKLLTKSKMDAFSYSISDIDDFGDNVYFTICKLYKSRMDRKPAINFGLIRLSEK